MSLLGSTVDNQGRTILRVVGDLWFDTSTFTGFFGFSYGMYVDTAEAVAAGATMEPRSDSASWMLLQQQNIGVGTNVGTDRAKHRPFDVRARRRLDAQSQLMLIFESAGMANVLNVELQGRVLLAQP